tara:strand:+ start:2238 stop:2690 length:453 start_codon:yes stop_codon:yes gene_type:complete
MLLIKATGSTVEQYPYSLGLLRKDNPNTSFPKQPSVADMAAFNTYPVTEANPIVGEGQHLVKVWTPTLVSGEWVLAHEAVDLTSYEIAEATAVLAANMREERNKRLAVTDWTSSSDVTMSAEMTAYRTALRNVPAQSDFPTVTWPTEVTE